MALDETDNRILKLLRMDGRMPYLQIADTLGISRITVKKRVDRMIDDDLINLNARVKVTKQGGKMALLGLEVKQEENWEECLQKLDSLPWVLLGFKSMGKANLRVLVYGENDEVLEKNIDAFRYYHCVNFIEAEILGKPVVGEI
jgi:Lrp/AsnC family leucine-responsive transcriptional regulator